MQTVNLIQGSPEWHAHRRNHFNASDAPAMMGVSKYRTRDQVLHEYATGIFKEADPKTQKIFDDGHKFEALARPLAERIIGADLSPTVGVDGKFSASFDGITFDGDVIFEHKTLNAELNDVFHNQDSDTVELPLMYRVQMEQQLMLSSAEKCLFMGSKWVKVNHATEHYVTLDEHGKIIPALSSGVVEYYEFEKEHHCWYYPDLELRAKIIAGWAQFETDLANYVPPVQVEKVVAETVEALPVPSVVVRGEITQSNIAEITPKFDAYLTSIKTELSTDQDFADAEANAKNCRETAKRIEALQDNIIAQMVSVNEVNSILGNYKEAFNKVGLRLEKAVKDQKESIKTAAIFQAKNDYANFVGNLQGDLPVTLHQLLQVPDFAGAIKGIKTIATMHSRINDALAQGKAQATTMANDIKAKAAYIEEASKGYAHLINVGSLATKDMDYIKLHIQSVKDAEDKRKAEHEAAIKAKAEAEARARVEAEQRLKALAEAQAIIDARAEAQAKSINEATPVKAEAVTLPSQAEAVSLAPQVEQAFNQTFAATKEQPSREQIVSLVADHYGVSNHQAQGWLNDLFYAMAA